jgi:hypothetical protein
MKDPRCVAADYKNHFQFITPCISEWDISQLSQSFFVHLLLPFILTAMRATFTQYVTYLNFIILKVFGGQYRLRADQSGRAILSTAVVGSNHTRHMNACVYSLFGLCGLVVRVPGYRSRDPRFDSRRYKIFWELVGLERVPLSLVNITEELFEWKSNGYVSRKPILTAVGIRYADHAAPSIRKSWY